MINQRNKNRIAQRKPNQSFRHTPPKENTSKDLKQQK